MAFDVFDLGSLAADRGRGKCRGSLRFEDFGEFDLIAASVNKPGDPASRKLWGDGSSVTRLWKDWEEKEDEKGYFR